MSGKDLLAQLNVAQRKAARVLDGPVLVVAGPGTGKTTLLTYRIAHILQKTDTKPYNILALTFSETAATNMRKKLFTLIGQDAYKVNIFTFHAFANYVINQYPEYFADVQDFEVANPLEKILILRDIILDNSLNLKALVGFSNPLSKLSSIQKTIEKLKREGITPAMLKEIIAIEKMVLEELPKESKRSKDGLTGKYKQQRRLVLTLEELLEVYKRYEKALFEHKRLDFSDLINIVNKKLEEDSEFALTLQEQYDYILVDEYQDTNTAQNRLLFNLLSFWQQNPNVFVVGDDDQAIYRFQGASVENIADFANTYPNRTDVVLNYNYRSTQLILDASANIREKISESAAKILGHLQKNLVAKNPYLRNKDEKIKVAEFNSETAELFFVVDKIKELHKQGVPYEQMAILVRRNEQVNAVADFLQKNEIPYSKSTGGNILQNPYILQIMNILRFLADFKDVGLFNRLLHYEFWNLESLSLIKFLQIFNDYLRDIQRGNIKLRKEAANLSLLDIKQQITSDFPIDEALVLLSKSAINKEQKEKIRKVIDKLVAWHTLSKSFNVLRLLEKVIDESKIIDTILTKPTKYEDLAAINSLLEYTRSLVDKNPDLSLTEFLGIFDLVERFNISLAGQPLFNISSGVQVMTAHNAKGLEFEVVFMPQFTERYWKPDISERNNLAPLSYITKRLDFSLPTVKEALKNTRLEEINHPTRFRNTRRQMAEDDQRRLFYVALTRAKIKVFISYSKFTLANTDKVKEQLPSSMLFDIPEEFVERVDTSKYGQITDTAFIKRLFKPSDLSSFYISTLDEEKYLKSLLTRFNLSPSALTSFLRDPNEFYLNYFLKVPTPTNIYQVYGSAVHRVIQEYFNALRRGEKMGRGEIVARLQSLLAQSHLTDQEISHLLKRADVEISTYYTQRLEPYQGYPLYVEKIAQTPFRGYPLKGIIDRVELIDKDKGYVRIVDVKTSSYKSLNNILGKTQDSENLAGFGSPYLIQLYFYKLLFDLDERLNKGKRYIPIKGAIDFTRPEDKLHPTLREPVEIEFDSVKYEELKQLVIEVLQQIYSLSFLKDVEKSPTSA